MIPRLLLLALLAAPALASDRVEKLLGQMTLAEKVGQLNLLTSDWDTTGPSTRADYVEGIRKGEVGAIFNAYTTAYVRKLQGEALKSRLKIPLLFGYDVIHGHRTIFPIPLGEAATFDTRAMEESARIAATEAAAEGIDWTFAPMVDIARDARWGRIAEGAGEDVYLGCRAAEARVRGFQGKDLAAPDSVAACMKHYAAYGAAEAGRDYNTVDMSERRLQDVYLPPFAAAVRAGVATVMAAFNDFNGRPCTANEYLLGTVLRDSMKFEGMVVTDYTAIAEMVSHRTARDEADAGEQALRAGIDMDMQSGIFQHHLPRLKDAAGPIDAAVRRVLTLKERLGLLDDPFRRCDAEREKREARAPAHLEAARRIAGESFVLLKNEQDLLPLDAKLGTVAVVGPLAGDGSQYLGSWCAAGDAKQNTALVDELKKRLGDNRVKYARGCELRGTDRSGFAAALAAATAASVVVAVMGEGADMSGEAASRAELGLPGVQRELLEKLLAAGKPVVLVLMNGRPLTLAWEAEHLPAILECWFPGSMAAEAIADTLLGDVNPSGRLPVSFPRAVGQVPLYYAAETTGRPFHPERPDDRYVSRYLDVANTPLFPFGFGLSYTRFGYGKPTLAPHGGPAGGPLTVTVEVTNSGARAGTAVVQLYATRPVAHLAPPALELAGFQRVLLDPGQTRAVTFDFPLRKPGPLTLSTGPDCAHLTAIAVPGR